MHIKLITIFIRMMALDVKGGRRLSVKIRSIIVKHHKAGLSTVKINEILRRKHDFTTTRQSIRRFLIRYENGFLHDQRLVYLHVCTGYLVMDE